MSSRNRKYDSGCEKRKKKQRLQAAAESQRGALDRFVQIEPRINSENQSPEANNVDEIERQGDDGNIGEQIEVQVAEICADELKNLDLDIDNVRGQGYDNGANMKGQHKGVQRKLLEINPRAFSMWESRVDSVKAIRFQFLEIREALLEVAESDNDPLTSSEAKSLAENELSDFEFLLAIIIWYEILSVVNLVSKQLQAKDMVIDIAIERVQGLISFFTKYREIGFSQAMEATTEVALEMGIDPVFRTKRKIKRKRQFDETAEDESIASQSAQESFRVNYFLAVVDQAIASLSRRFEQYQGYQNTFGFLFTSDKLHSLDDKSLLSSALNLEAALKNGEHSDIDGK